MPEVAAFLLRETRSATPERRLLDLGTGTGFVVEALKRDLAEITGADIDADMPAAARADVVPMPGQQITWACSGAEDFHHDAGWQPDLVTIARACRWIGQHKLLARLYGFVADEGTLAVMGDQSVFLSRRG